MALCDVDSNLFDDRVKKHFTEKSLPKPKLYTDLRKLYEDKDVDAVSVVTPNHWHALASIWAIQAGKHVSVEKPCCHNFFEGQKLVEAAEKYKVIVQDGAEQRSNPCASEWLITFTAESWEKSIWRKGFAINGVIPLGKRLMSRYQQELIMICGSDQPPNVHSQKTGFIITGTGTGTLETEIWETRVFMKWILPDGD